MKRTHTNDTPRTNARVRLMLSQLQSGTEEVVHADFARELELEIAKLRKEHGAPTDEPNPNGSTHARLNWWKDRCDELHA